LLKVGVQSIDTLISTGRLKAVVRTQGTTRLILIERISLLKLKHELEHSLYLKQVQQILGLTHERVLELVTYKLLNPLRGPITDGCSDWRFSEKEVKDLLEKIKKRVGSHTSKLMGEKTSFLMALRKLRRAQISMCSFIKDIIGGKIYPCEMSSKIGLNAFQFFRQQITEYILQSAENIK
jgi:hypothetical protein